MILGSDCFVGLLNLYIVYPKPNIVMFIAATHFSPQNIKKKKNKSTRYKMNKRI